MKSCHKCKTEWKGITEPGTKDECVRCGADLHVCLNCRHYNIPEPYQCSEPDIDPVTNKERYNFCDLFQFRDILAANKGNVKNGDSNAKEVFDKLFKK